MKIDWNKVCYEINTLDNSLESPLYRLGVALSKEDRGRSLSEIERAMEHLKRAQALLKGTDDQPQHPGTTP